MRGLDYDEVRRQQQGIHVLPEEKAPVHGFQPIKKFCMLRGLSGSGKSTLADGFLLTKMSGQAVRVNMDSLREMLHLSRWSPDAEKVTQACRDAILSESMRFGIPLVISDDTNLTERRETTFRCMAKFYGYTFHVLDLMDVPIDTCIERDRLRGENGGRSVGEEVIRGQMETYLKSQRGSQ